MKKILTLTLLSSLLIPCLTSCSLSSGKSGMRRAANKPNELTIYNCADYIDEEIIAEFESEYGCKVNYYTYDTNETLYNQFTLQPEGTYDLICTSDYMLQRMIREGLLQEIDIQEEVPVYNQYASLSIRDKLKNMKVDLDKDGVKETSLDNYIVGYMWGTLGIIYDPETSETMQEDVMSWNVFWDNKYENLISIKNSMRDTMVVGLMHAYAGSTQSGLEDILNPAREAYEQVVSTSEDEEEILQARNTYNKVIQDTFDLIINKENYREDLDIIKNELITLKQNIFGFEVDQGKNDIITGKIKMNLAWSGDAIYSISQALEEADKVLEYAVPLEGSNVWYDGWGIPQGANRELAIEFLNYISSPDSATRNMDYIGYTPFIASDEVFDLTTAYYGVSAYNEEYEYTVDGEYSACFYEDKFYSCIQDCSGVLPTNTEYFEETTIEDLGLLEETYDLAHIFRKDNDTKDYRIYAYEDSYNSLLCQYPDDDILARCAVMNDFEDRNGDVVIMWGQVKAYVNMVPYYVILIVIAVIIIFYFTFTIIQKKASLRRKLGIEKN